MRKRWIHRPSPALVISCIALIVALGGTSYATVLNVPPKSVGTPQMKRGAVGTAQLKRNAVKTRQLAPNSVRSAHVLNGSLLAADFKAGQLPKGDKGDKGEKGDTGPVGVASLEIVTNQPPSTSQNKTVTANCPNGKKVLGGGAVLAAYDELQLYQLYPTNNNAGWAAYAAEVTPVAFDWGLRVYAVCATVG